MKPASRNVLADYARIPSGTGSFTPEDAERIARDLSGGRRVIRNGDGFKTLCPMCRSENQRRKPPRTLSLTARSGKPLFHPTSKPNRLFAIRMLPHTRVDDLCYEPFSGSGSQLIAAEQLGRRCYALELEPRFVDVAIARWETLTGSKAELVAEVSATAAGSV
jgi:DNA modification methylase